MEKNHDIINATWSNNYHILNNKKEIEVCEENLRKIRRINVSKVFSAITYSETDNVYFLVEKGNNRTLFFSNDLINFNVEKLIFPTSCDETILDITYCKCKNSLLITTKNKLYLYDLCTKCIKEIFHQKDELAGVNDCMGPLGCTKYAKKTLISAICCCDIIYVLYYQNGISYIAKLNKDNLLEIVYESCYFIKTMFTKDGYIWILICNECGVSFINTGISCYEGCEKVSDCKCQIIESVASIEKSIAKILSSESLKIKAAIKNSGKVDDLICVNSSVREIIYYVTILEFVLTEKLKTVTDKNDCECK